MGLAQCQAEIQQMHLRAGQEVSRANAPRTPPSSPPSTRAIHRRLYSRAHAAGTLKQQAMCKLRTD